jgi:hypothetical protein
MVSVLASGNEFGLVAGIPAILAMLRIAPMFAAVSQTEVTLFDARRITGHPAGT